MAPPLVIRQGGKDLEVYLLGPNGAKEAFVRPDLALPELVEVLVVGVPAAAASSLLN